MVGVLQLSGVAPQTGTAAHNDNLLDIICNTRFSGQRNGKIGERPNADERDLFRVFHYGIDDEVYSVAAVIGKVPIGFGKKPLAFMAQPPNFPVAQQYIPRACHYGNILPA